jgi:hypothetical protein
MPIEPVHYIGSLLLDSESQSSKSYRFIGANRQEADIIVRDGKIVSIEHDVAPRFEGVQVVR